MSGLLAKTVGQWTRAATRGTPRSRVLLRVKLDDELFLDGETDVFALRDIVDRTAELSGLHREPGGNAAAGSRFHGLADLVVLAALFAHLNHIPLAGLVGGDVDLPAIDFDVAVTDELT